MIGPARLLHPVAWWLWAAGLAVAAAHTTNLVLLALLAAAAGRVVAARRIPAPWSQAFSVFLRLGLIVIAVRTLFAVLLVGGTGSTVLFRLPQIPLPPWAAGLRLGGPVTAEAALAALGDGARLAVMLACFGAANALASPARLARCLPRGLHAFGVTTTVALSAAPQLVAAFGRVRGARRLRGLPTRGVRSALTVVVPVLEEALDRALTTAAALDARGFGRHAPARTSVRRLAVGGLLAGPILAVVGVYVLLGTSASVAGTATVGVGAVVIAAGLRAAGAGIATTRYRPDRWRLAEWLTAASGVGCAVALVAAGPGVLAPDPWSLQVPTLSVWAIVAVAAAVAPAALTPAATP